MTASITVVAPYHCLSILPTQGLLYFSDAGGWRIGLGFGAWNLKIKKNRAIE